MNGNKSVTEIIIEELLKANKDKNGNSNYNLVNIISSSSLGLKDFLGRLSENDFEKVLKENLAQSPSSDLCSESRSEVIDIIKTLNIANSIDIIKTLNIANSIDIIKTLNIANSKASEYPFRQLLVEFLYDYITAMSTKINDSCNDVEFLNDGEVSRFLQTIISRARTGEYSSIEDIFKEITIPEGDRKKLEETFNQDICNGVKGILDTAVKKTPEMTNLSINTIDDLIKVCQVLNEIRTGKKGF